MKKLVFVYIILSTWYWFVLKWIWEVNQSAAFVVCFIYPILQLLPFILYWRLKKRSMFLPVVVFISSWILIEYLHGHSQFSAPYMNLGNFLVHFPSLIQWYEYTGVLGGTLWILITIFLLAHFLKAVFLYKKKQIPFAVLTFLCISAPIIISYIIQANLNNTPSDPIEVVAVHTNAGCMDFKYKITPKELVDYYLETTLPAITSETAYIIWPENAIRGSHWIGTKGVESNDILKHIRDTLSHYSAETNLIAGIFLRREVNTTSDDDYYANYDEQNDVWFHRYNGAISIESNLSHFDFRTKQKLVPFEEYTPYPRFFDKVQKMINSLGGFNFNSIPENGKVFYNKHYGLTTAMIICYESFFGEEITKYTRNGAQLLFIGLNEGWYKNTNAPKYFNNTAILRAIENRKYVIRSSNDGITSIIDPNGKIQKELDNFKPQVIKYVVYPNSKATFYAKHGDYLGRISIIILLLYLIYFIIYKFHIRNTK